MKYKFNQYAIVEFNNCGPDVRLFQSNKPMTINKIAARLEKTEGFNEDVDSLTLVSAPTKYKI